MALYDFQRLSARGAYGIEPFPDPFMDYASLVMPETINHALQWAEFLLSKNGIYAAAIKRVIGFFITDLKIEGASRAERARYKEFLVDGMGIQSILRTLAFDFLTYGNSFTSLIVPFRRALSCKQCGFEAPLKQIKGNRKFEYKWTGYEFHASCPFCNYKGEWHHVDRRDGSEDGIRIKRWNPKEFELLWDPYSDRVEYVWRIPSSYRADIRRGELIHIESVPWEVVTAVRNNNNLLFDKGVVYHMKEETLAGIWNRGWGISSVLANFGQAWYVQVLHRFNEAIAMDYVIPLRVICPDVRSGGTMEGNDPVLSMDMGSFSANVHNILRHRRQDPMAWHVSPFPLKYQIMGMEANTMAPFQLMDQGIDTLLNSIGVPVEFYKANLTTQAAPAALRLMESNWSHLTHALNRFLHWLVTRLADVMAWDKVTCKLERPSHADDINRQLAKLQVMTAGLISKKTGLGSIGVDATEETRLMYEEKQEEAEIAQEAQEAMEAKQMGQQLPDIMAQQQQAAMGQMPGAPPGMPPPGGAPPAGGAMPAGAGMQPGMPVDPVEAILAALPTPDQPISPPELHQAAETIASQAIGLHSTQRISLLRRLKEKNPTVWAVVKSKLEMFDNQARTQGKMMMQQAAQQGQTQSMAPMPV